MKASKLVKELQDIVDAHGDQEVIMESGDVYTIDAAHFCTKPKGAMNSELELLFLDTYISILY